jgi:hypothetical protein
MVTLGKLRQQVYTRLAEQYTKKEQFKKTFNSIMSVLNENKELKQVFNIYTDFEKRHISDTDIATEFVTEAVNTIKGYMTENYISGLKKLSTLVGDVTCEQNEVTKNLDVLVHSTGYDTLVERIESKKYLVKTLTEEKTVSESIRPVSQSILTSLLTTKFNEKYSSMNESELSTFKRYSSMNESEIENTINDLKNEIKESIETLKENVELKSVVMEVENKVDNTSYDLLSLLKLEQLKESLS